MGINRVKEKVRDGYLVDLPETIRTKVMNVHKIINDAVKALLDDPNYRDLKESNWAMSCIDEFCAMPKDKGAIGSARAYKKGNNYRCMIQATGHFRNHQYGWIEELLHEFIANVYATVRPQIRKKFDMTTTNEGRTGNPFEGFDVYPTPKEAKDIWELFEDRKTKNIIEENVIFEEECEEDIEESNKKCIILNTEMLKKLAGLFDFSNTNKGSNDKEIRLNEFPYGFIKMFKDTKALIKSELALVDYIQYNQPGSIPLIDYIFGTEDSEGIDVGFIKKKDDDNYAGLIPVSIPLSLYSDMDGIGSHTIAYYNKLVDMIYKKISKSFNDDNPAVSLEIKTYEGSNFFVISFLPDYAKELWKYIGSRKNDTMTESAKNQSNTPEYNTDMSEKEAKNTLRILSQSIINDPNKKITQYTANIYANIITKNLLPIWAGSFRKLSITLDDQLTDILEFKVPSMTQDFVSRFIQGRETIAGFLHRQPEIKIRMSSKIFSTMKNPDDAFVFFKAAIQYYDKQIDRYSEKLMVEVMKLNHGMKHLISTTKLSGIVIYPMSLLFVFDHVNMSNKDTFKISQEDIKTINRFIKNISSRYAAPEKEKREIINDVKEMVRSLHESCGLDVNNAGLRYLPEAIEHFYFGGFNKELGESDQIFINEQVDYMNMRQQKNPEVKYLQEKFGVKKLKKIPNDIVAYISIETECIKDANDKMMISSYCLSKIEIVEWYIELLEVGSKKYVVPHTKPYLENLRTQLLSCFKKIMATPIPKSPSERPIIDIQYPKGYEG